ncbi:PadR family transcriptional regulator [Lentilactobacillus senioris]|uniref:PadR family transcriptional regulator n=1 Tax=Lentilactobacillus senioris TaxID=931534 RepID=UPI003D291E91
MPKKRILPYILLGLINDKGQLSGHDISTEFTHEIGEFWQASHSQVYPELQRMVSDGWIEVVNTQSTNKKQIFYQLTREGQQVLSSWLHEPFTDKDEYLFALKLYFIRQQTDPLLRSLITAELDYHQRKVNHLNERQALLFNDSDQVTNHFGHSLILQRAILRETTYVDWLSTTLQQLNTNLN